MQLVVISMNTDLSEIPTAELIKRIKANPDNSSYTVEVNKRLKNGELSDGELVELLNILVGGD